MHAYRYVPAPQAEPYCAPKRDSVVNQPLTLSRGFKITESSSEKLVNKNRGLPVVKRHSAPNNIRQSKLPYQEFMELRLQEKIVSSKIAHLKQEIVYLKKMSDKTHSDLKAKKTNLRNQSKQIIDLLTSLMLSNSIKLNLTDAPELYSRIEKNRTLISESTDFEDEWTNCKKACSINNAVKDALKQTENVPSSSLRALLRKR